MRENIIFIGGIHGVGKTTISEEVAENTGIKNYSASDLIKNINSNKLWENKKVKDVDGNQYILLKAIKSYISNRETCLLDGHFCLIDDNDNIDVVPYDIFKNMNILKIIVIVDNPNNIVEKLKSRDQNLYSLNFIKDFQEKEIEYAKDIANKLDKEILIVNYENKDEIYKFIEIKKEY